jgi:preprotein translocase subunit Sec61beta
MADNRISVPSGFGGLLRFEEEPRSKINLKPEHVVVFVGLIILFRIFLGVLY